MSSWYKHTPSEKRTMLVNVADEKHTSEAAVEKDWWVTVVLRALAQCSCKDAYSFKGGTSLSKGWNLIKRFSEDIDIAIDKSFFGIERSNKSQREKLRKASRAYICGKLVSELEGILKGFGINGFKLEYVEEKDSDKDPTVVFLPYTSIIKESDSYTSESVKIELSCRSMNEPCREIPIKSLIEEVYTDEDDDNVCYIRTVLPSRTFLEKIFLLHEEYQKEHIRTNRMSRHLYDLALLMDTEFGEAALKDTKMYADIVNHRSIYTAMRGIDYARHTPTNIRIVPPESVIDFWRADYQNMLNSFIFDKSLSFDQLIEKMKTLEERVHKLSVELNIC